METTYQNSILKIKGPTHIEVNATKKLEYVRASKEEEGRLKVKHLIVIQGEGTNPRIEKFQRKGFTISSPMPLNERTP